MRAQRVAAIAALCACALAARPAAADGAPAGLSLVEEPRATTQELRNDTTEPQVGVMLLPRPGVAIDALTPQVTDVALGAVHATGLLSAFGADLVPLAEGPGAQLQIRIDPRRVVQPGTYLVTVTLSGLASGSDPAPSQDILLHLVLPTPQLRPLGRLVMERTLSPVSSASWSSSNAVTLRELGDRTTLDPLSVEQVGETVHDGSPILARLKPVAPARILHGQGGDIRFELEGELPAGTSSGKIEIRAPQLDAPIVADFELRARYDDRWIIPLYIMAGILGWLFRIYLRGREQLHALQAQASEVLRRLTEQLARDPEPADELSLKGRSDELRAAVTGSDLAALGAAIKAAQEALTAAAASRAQLKSGLLTRIGTEDGALAKPWRLPPSISLKATRDAWAEARKALFADKLGAVIEWEEKARSAFSAEATLVEDWQKKALGALADCRKAALPEEARAALEGEVATRAIQAIPLFDATQPAATEAYLRAVHEAQGALRRLVEALCAGLRRAAEGAASAAGSGHPAEAAALRESVNAATVDGKDDLVGALEDTTGAATKLYEGVQAALTNINASPLDPDEVKGHLDAGHYAAAILAAKKKRALPGQESVSFVSSGGVKQQPTSAALAGSAPGEQSPPAVVREVALVEPGPPTVDVILARSFRMLALDRCLIGTISAVLLSFIAWATYRHSWVGSVMDWIGVAAVAFTVDFTADAVLESVSKLKKA